MRHIVEPNILEFFLIYGVLLLACLLWRRYIKKDLTFNRGIYFALLVGYLLMIGLLSVQPMTEAEWALAGEKKNRIGFMPFQDIMYQWQSPQGCWQIIGCLILPVPLMFFIGFSRCGRISLLRLVFMGFSAAVLLESLQFFLNVFPEMPRHLFNSDDIILSTAGSLIGAAAFCLLVKKKWMRQYISDIMS